MKNVQKSVRLSDRVVKYVEGYRGANFSEKLENLILDAEERHDDLVLDWNRLQAAINDKRDELRRIQSRVRKIREVDTRLAPLSDAVLQLIQD